MLAEKDRVKVDDLAARAYSTLPTLHNSFEHEFLSDNEIEKLIRINGGLGVVYLQK